MINRKELFPLVEECYELFTILWVHLRPYRYNEVSTAKNMYLAVRHEYLHIEDMNPKVLETPQLLDLAHRLIVLSNVVCYSYQVFTTSDIKEGLVHHNIEQLLSAVETLQLWVDEHVKP